jgi:hypothetical protein
MRFVILMAVSTALAGCATEPQVDFMPKKLVLEEFFPGRVIARGTFKPTLVGMERGLTVIIDSTWDGKVLTLAEDFTYDDGELDKKTWRFTRTAERTYTGTREDVIGTARTFPDGDAMRLEYQVVLKTEAYGDLHVRFRDIMALEDDGTLINKAVVSKWGIKLGDVELRMTRETPPAS